MDISLVVPLDKRIQYTKKLFVDIGLNNHIPKEIILIDNSNDLATLKVCELMRSILGDKVNYIPMKENIGVNRSWSYGIELASEELVTILNNDLVIGHYFFAQILKEFEADPNVGIVVPNTLGSPLEVKNFKYASDRVEPLEIREGWAFTIRKSVVKDEPPIPKTMFNFCGDDYLFGLVKQKGYKIIKAMNVPVHHITAGVSFRSVHDKEEEAKAKLDHKAWKEWKEQNGWED